MEKNFDQEIIIEQKRQSIEKKIKGIILPIAMEIFGKDDKNTILYENAQDINQVAYQLSRHSGESWEEKVNSVLDAYFRHANKEALEKLPELKSRMIQKLEEEFNEE